MKTRYVLLLLLLLCACERRSEQTNQRATIDSAAAPAAVAEPPVDVPVEAQPRDSAIVQEKLAWARANHLDTLPIGEIVARIGRTMVGQPYVPATLEVPGPERLVVNLREFDCVTFVENSLALARVVRSGQGGYDAFKRELLKIRYRGGKLDGYPSRLHYFSEWIADNQAKGIVKNITRELGGVTDTEPINFMTSHRESYRQLKEDSALVAQIRAREGTLNATPRYYIPEDRIGAVADKIHDGDIIAATSTLTGLDVVHTGIALWVNGKLHLMHAPLVGKAVEISELPLAERIKSIEKQDGVMVARPQ